MKEYKKRVADGLLADKLDAMGAVLIEGPKYCGKTMMACQQAKSILFMADPDTKEQNMQLARTNIKRLLQGMTPRLIDEWQMAPQFWDAVRYEVDNRDDDGQFILTGSAMPPNLSQIFHSGTGRIARMKLRTMSLWESGESTGNVSLSALFKNPDQIDGASIIDIEQLAFLACRGGWPKSTLKKNRKASLMQAKEYFETVCQIDMSRVDDVQRNPELVRRIMRSYARNQGTQASAGTILADIKANESDEISENTIYTYLNAMRMIFVTDDTKAWNPNLRSKTAIRSSDTRYFIDPSIATAALGACPDDLINDLKTFGFIFETLCMRDLKVYTDALDGTVYHYRDKNNLECDAVIHRSNGQYGLIEIKLGGEHLINEGAKTLLAVANKMDPERMRKPSFMMVLTGVGDYAYRRSEDGVLVVPIGCLKD